MDHKRIAANIPKLYAFTFFHCFLVMMPVLVPFWEEKGLTLKEIFTLQAIFGVSLIAFDIPAGYAADLFGRRKSMIIGGIVAALSYQILWLGQTFWDYVAFEIVCGLGLSLTAGCDVALLYNSLEQTNHTDSKTRILGNRVMAMTLGEGIASLIGGLLATISLSMPIYVMAFTVWLPVIVAFTLTETEGQNLSRHSHMENVRAIAKATFGHSKLLTFAMLGFVFYGFATYCAVWASQPYWKDRGLPYEYFGYLWALNCFISAFVARYAHAIEIKIGAVASILIIALLPIAGYFGMAITPGVLGVAFGFAFPICRGLNHVLFTDAINARVPAEMRSTINSIGNLGMRGLFVLFGPLIGGALDSEGPNGAFMILGMVFTVGFFALALPLLSQRHQFRAS